MHKEPEVDSKRTCRFIEYTDLVGTAFSERQSDLICEAMTNSEISYGNNTRTMVSLTRMCDLVRSVDDLEPDEANTIVDKLCELLEYNEYIDVEN